MGVVKPVRRFEIWLAELDPTVGSDMQKARPCVVLSPDELNSRLRTVLIAPLTGSPHRYSWRPSVFFAERDSHVALERIRAVDRSRLVRRLGDADASTTTEIVDKLAALFAR